jgi:imidazolonepropionase-like amidohydrolase
VIDSINFRSPDFDRLVRGGVTTVFAAPDSAAVIGPRGAVVRTAGPIKSRVMNDASDVLAAFGSDSFRFGGGNQSPFGSFVTNRTRRPNSRMGVAWVFRKAFYDAEKELAGQPVTGADQPPTEAFETLGQVRGGEVPLRIKARLQRDIEAAFRLSREFGLNFTLVEATEAYKCLPVIVEGQVPVIFGPIYIDPNGVRSFSEETRESRLSTVKMLVDAGVETAITAMDLREEDGLARQAMYAMRAGLSFDDALKAVTLTPAKMLGIDDEVGSIEVGKRGDVVVWSGQPFDATARPVAVVMDGKIVYDAR